jgi:histidyl-tRNA synthetase
LEAAGIAPDKHGEALVAIDKLDKIGREGVAREFDARGISAKSGEELLGFFEDLSALEHAAEFVAGGGGVSEVSQAEAYNRAALGRLVEFVGENEAGARGVDELRRVVEYASAYGVADRVKIDPSLARGLSYYTGAIMEIAVPDLAGSLGGGGRYDNLVGMFSGKEIPACGFSLGLERIIVVMSERGMFAGHIERPAADVLVTIWNEESVRDSLALAAELRGAVEPVRVEVYPEADKLGKQLKYASARGIPYVAVVGDDERARGEVALKYMPTGEQETVAREQAALILEERLHHAGGHYYRLRTARAVEGGGSQAQG